MSSVEFGSAADCGICPSPEIYIVKTDASIHVSDLELCTAYNIRLWQRSALRLRAKYCAKHIVSMVSAADVTYDTTHVPG